MVRLGLRYKLGKSPPPDERSRVTGHPGVKVLRDVGSMLSVECDEETAGELKNSLENWTVAASKQIRLDPPPKEKHGAHLKPPM